jgi:archaeosine-15-forming tRNA-guanine transglycosylase
VDALDAILKANDLVAVLGREVSVRLVDISGSGCLLESACRLEKGTTGSLRVVFDGMEYVDDVRVMRCRPSEGSSSLYFLGAEFLWTSSPHERSLRRVLATLQATAVKTGKLDMPPM